MKKFLFVTLAAISIPAAADSVSGTIEHHYSNVVESVPRYTTECVNVDVPVRKNDNGDRLLGGIAGGILGSTIGGGDGKTAATVIGAIVGSEVARSDNVIEYRRDKQCNTMVQYDNTTRRKYDYSTIRFYHNGQEHIVKFYK